MLDANTAIAGSMYRSLNWSMCIVSSSELNVKSTPFWVATLNVTELSVTSWDDRVAPVRTVNSFGKRILRSLPILAPVFAYWSSYWRSIEPTKLSFWCKIARASLVMTLGVSSELAILVTYLFWVTPILSIFIRCHLVGGLWNLSARWNRLRRRWGVSGVGRPFSGVNRKRGTDLG